MKYFNPLYSHYIKGYYIIVHKTPLSDRSEFFIMGCFMVYVDIVKTKSVDQFWFDNKHIKKKNNNSESGYILRLFTT